MAELDREQLCALTAQFRHKAVAWADQEQALLNLARSDLVAMGNAVHRAVENGAPLSEVAERLDLLRSRSAAASHHGDLITQDLDAAFPAAVKREGAWAP